MSSSATASTTEKRFAHRKDAAVGTATAGGQRCPCGNGRLARSAERSEARLTVGGTIGDNEGRSKMNSQRNSSARRLALFCLFALLAFSGACRGKPQPAARRFAFKGKSHLGRQERRHCQHRQRAHPRLHGPNDHALHHQARLHAQPTPARRLHHCRCRRSTRQHLLAGERQSHRTLDHASHRATRQLIAKNEK